jgi:hypothetical protein
VDMETVKLNRIERRKVQHSKPLQKVMAEMWRVKFGTMREQLYENMTCKKLSSWIKHPKQKIFGMTWVAWLNLTILQWFFVRLVAVHVEGVATWKLIRFVVPVTGYAGKFVTFKENFK